MYKNTCKRKIYRFYFSLVGNKSTFSIVKTRGNVNCMVHSNNYFLIKKRLSILTARMQHGQT